MMKGIAAIVVAFLCLPVGPVHSTAAPAQEAQPEPGAAGWYRAYQQNSRLVRLPGGRALNLYCTGEGSPTVILESGIGGGAFDWWKVQDRMARTSRVCAYDRAGIGRSPAGPLPRDTKSQVADLEALLRAARIRSPYVMVGHSMGGLNVRLFASRHPGDVAGMVLVDPSVENQLPLLERAVPTVAPKAQRYVKQLRACADPSRSAEVARQCARPAPEGFPPDLAAAWAATQGLANAQTGLSEVEAFLGVDSQQVVAERRSLGAMPLIVLTRGERSSDMPADQAETEWRLWNGLHEDVARQSSAGRNRVIEGANHYIQLDRPDAVVAAVQEVVAAARERRPKKRG